MRKLIALTMIFALTATAAPKLQDADFKSEADLIAAGSTAAQLLNDSKVYITANGLNKKLSTAITDGDIGASSNPDNKLTNPGFEKGTTGWTASAGTFASTTTSSEVFEGAKAVTWDSSAASQTLTGTAITVGGFAGQNAELTCNVRVPSGTATHTLGVWDGSTLSNAITLQNPSGSTKYFPTTINFIAPSSGTVTARFTSVASDEPSISIDDCYLGKARNIGSVSQARLIGSVKITGCAAQWATTSTTFANFATVASCVYDVKGEALAPLTNIPAIRFASLPAGTYRLEYQGAMISPTNTQGRFRFSDGTNVSDETSIIGDAAGQSARQHHNGMFHTITYDSPQNNILFQIQGQVTANTLNLTGTTTNPGVINVWYFPSSDQQVYNPTLNTWKVDANISGANPSLGTASITTYTGITNASLSLTNNSGQGNIAAEIPCSATNPSSGTTCSVGDESVGVAFNLPKAGDVLACASFAHDATSGSGGTVTAYFQVVETGNADQTILQEGKSRISSGPTSGSTAGRYPNRVCGTFSFSSSGKKTLRLMYEQGVSVTAPLTNTILADANTAAGQRDIHWEVYPISQLTPAPVLVGSVSSGTSGAERIERLSLAETDCAVTAGSDCTIKSQSGNWVTNVTRQGIGLYTVNLVNGTFSAEPTCSCSHANNGARSCAVRKLSSDANTVAISTFVNGTTLENGFFDLICMGPK